MRAEEPSAPGREARAWPQRKASRRSPVEKAASIILSCSKTDCWPMDSHALLEMRASAETAVWLVVNEVKRTKTKIFALLLSCFMTNVSIKAM